MCGIFGIIAKTNSDYSFKFLSRALENLAILSEARGKESGGFAFRIASNNEIKVLRAPVEVSKILKTSEYIESLKKSIFYNNQGTLSEPFVVIGHSRLVTNGSQLEDDNNQPVIKDDIVAVHNGIIVNVDKLWEEYTSLERKFEIDTEIFLSLFRKYYSETRSLKSSTVKSLNDIEGTIATAMLFSDLNKVLLATNNGSLYTLTNNKDIIIFASEGYILKTLVEKSKLIDTIGTLEVKQLRANDAIIVDYQNFVNERFNIKNEINYDVLEKNNQLNNYTITQKTLFENSKKKQLNSLFDINSISKNPKAIREQKLLEYNIEAISKLKRCSKCILPETFPFINFDENGVCNYCRNYIPKNRTSDLTKLEELVKPFRKSNGEMECIVPFSGGRDSSFSLHILRKELKLNIISYTYDWGMVTDLARRNIARICGKLGIENIIVSANISQKRKNIRKNILAWLKKPNLGMVPIFMAGDKSFFYYMQKIQKQTGISLNIWGENYLENTDFKVGFAGVPPSFKKERIYKLSSASQFRLLTFLLKQYITNSSYINESLFDNMKSHYSRSFAPKVDYYNFFEFYKWDEKEVESVILNEYNWEKAIDTSTTWRIGDGTASFYNYIYYTIAGFTEHDTFRSNQIREGMLTREKALNLVNDENQPRFENIKWYLEILGLDYESTLKRINSIQKLYPKL